MDRKRSAEDIKGVPVVADLLQDDAKAGERPEMAGFAGKHFADICKGPAEVFLHVVHGRAPVPGLHEIRLYLDGSIKSQAGFLITAQTKEYVTQVHNCGSRVWADFGGALERRQGFGIPLLHQVKSGEIVNYFLIFGAKS